MPSGCAWVAASALWQNWVDVANRPVETEHSRAEGEPSLCPGVDDRRVRTGCARARAELRRAHLAAVRSRPGATASRPADPKTGGAAAHAAAYGDQSAGERNDR